MSVLFAIVLGIIISESDLVPFNKSNEEISEKVVIEKKEEIITPPPEPEPEPESTPEPELEPEPEPEPIPVPEPTPEPEQEPEPVKEEVSEDKLNQEDAKPEEEEVHSEYQKSDIGKSGKHIQPALCNIIFYMCFDLLSFFWEEKFSVLPTKNKVADFATLDHPLFISYFVFRRLCAEFFFSKKVH